MRFTRILALLPLCTAGLASAQDAAGTTKQTLGLDGSASTDADDTRVTKIGLRWDFRYDDFEHYRGLKLEDAHFAPQGQGGEHQQRVYYRFADTGARWKWNGALGTDGHTWLGSASIYNEARYRQEYFVERDTIETPMGLEHDLRHTFVGAAYDLPINDRNMVTALAGVQDFTGDNTRLHLRARYIAVLNQDIGLSAQLRTRYWRNSTPREFDYYSPEWYGEVLPTLQIRRFHGRWQYHGAIGMGVWRDTDSDWRPARLVQAGITSPKIGRDWFFKANLTHTNTPITTGYKYDYTQVMFEFHRVF